MSSSAHVDNRTIDILILAKDPTQGLELTLAKEKMCSINLIVTKKKFCLSLHYNGSIVTCLLMVQKLLNFNQKILKL